ELNDIKELKNKKIEFARNELANISIKAILKAHNVEVNAIEHTFTIDTFAAKKSDAIVGYLSNQPYFLIKQNIPYTVYNPKDFGFDFYGDLVYTSTSMVEKNPKVVADFVNASKKGWEYAFEHLNSSVDLIYEKYNTQNKSKEALAYEASVLKSLSGYGHNFGEFKLERVQEIGKVIALLFPQKFKNIHLENLIWNESRELIEYYKNGYLKNNNTFNVCVLDNLFPIDGINEGKLTGISGDVLNKIAQQFGLVLKPIQSKSFKEHVENIRQNKCDILTITAEDGYKQFGNMKRSQFYLDSNLVIVTKVDKPFMDTSGTLLNKKFITKYAIAKKYLSALYPNINVEINENIDAVIKKLENDEIDGYITDNITVDRVIQTFGYGKYKISGFLGNEKPIRGAFGVIDSKPELVEILNIGIESFSQKELKEIKENWKVTRYSTIVDTDLVLKLIVGFLFIFSIVAIVVFILKRHNKELNEWLDSTIEGIAIFENGRLIKANKQLLSIFGYKELSEIYLKTYFDFVIRQQHKEITKRLQNNQEPYELTFIKKDGTLFDGLIKGRNIRGTNKRISTIIDISELKNAQKELKELNTHLEEKVRQEIAKNEHQQTIMFQQSKLAEMGSILNMIAHQWRQPLNNISLIVNTIIIKQKKGILDLNALTQYKQDFQKQINYLSNTINDFQNFFKPKKEKEYFKIYEVVMNTYSLLKPIFEKNHIVFSSNIDATIEYFGYKNELAQVLLNIFNNSKDALWENHISNKLLRVELTQTPENLMLILQDNGGGVEKSNLEKIFEPYFSTKNEKNGTGLGLYISKIIINDHFKGDISARNCNEGLEISITIPTIINKNSDYEIGKSF
ncbi:MAG: transporter substrate-binding domain-containing protein, partial [Arcobacteraceae bacterium]